MQSVKLSILLALALFASALGAQDGDLKVEASATLEEKAAPGAEVVFRLIFVVPDGYHAYHKDNPGLSIPVKVKFSELSGLEQIAETWPRYHETDDGFGEGGVEYTLDNVFELLWTFKVPTGASGSLTLAGMWDVQFCDEDGCLFSSGRFSESLAVAAAPAETWPTEIFPGPNASALGGFDFVAGFTAPEVRPGAEAVLQLRFKMKENADGGHYHLHHPKTPSAFAVPLVPRLVGDGGLVADGEWKFPKPKVVYDEILEEDNWYLLGEVVVSRRFKVPADLKPGRYRVFGDVTGQYCDDDGCVQFDRKNPRAADRKFGWVAYLTVAGKPVSVAQPVDPRPPGPRVDDGGLTWFATADAALSAAALQERPIFIHFGAPVAAELKAQAVIALLAREFVLAEFDPATEAGAAALSRFSKESSPRYVLLEASGKALAESPAGIGAAALEKFLRKALAPEIAPEEPRDAKDKHGFYLDFDYAMSEAKRLNKPLLVDFNGKFCRPCRIMEMTVFTLPEVHRLMQGYVRASVRNDIGNERYNALWEKYKPSKAAGVPYYAVLDHEGKEVRGIGSTLPAKKRSHEFIAFLKGDGGSSESPDPNPVGEGNKPKGWPRGLPAPAPASVVEAFDLEAAFSAAQVQPGGKVTLEIRLSMKHAGGKEDNFWHFYHPKSPFAGPFALVLKDDVGLGASPDWNYPPPHVLKGTWITEDKDEWLFEGEIVIVREFALPSGTSAGDYVVTGTLGGQYCATQGCILFDPFGWTATLSVAPDGVAEALVPPSMKAPDRKAGAAKPAPKDLRDAAPEGFLSDYAEALEDAEDADKDILIYFYDPKSTGWSFADSKLAGNEEIDRKMADFVRVALPADGENRQWQQFAPAEGGAPYFAIVTREGEVQRGWSVASAGKEEVASFVNFLEGGFFELMLLLLAAFLGGMITLLTPCVLPVLPLTIGFFVKQAEKKRSPLVTAGIYAFCIISSFTFFGLLTSVTLGGNGAQILATNGWVNIGLGLLFSVFALSFLGLFELRVPTFITSWINRKQMKAQQQDKGYATAFLSGSSFSLITFSCSAPIAAMFLAGAAAGEFWRPTLMMLAYSSGLALPIFIMGQFPSIMKKMPKSGGWMNAMKVVFGFIEIGLAVMYFSAAEQAFFEIAAPEIITRTIVIATWVVMAAMAGVYLLGYFRLPHDLEPVERIGVLRVMFASMFLIASLFLLPGLFGANMGKVLEGILPPPLEDAESAFDGKAPVSTGEDGLVGSARSYKDLFWHQDLDEGLAAAKESGKPVFIDFTGLN